MKFKLSVEDFKPFVAAAQISDLWNTFSHQNQLLEIHCFWSNAGWYFCWQFELSS